MADVIARREARRKRILENASSRLEKITGRKEDISLDSNNDNSTPGTSKIVETDHIVNGCVPALPVEEFSSILRGRAPVKHQSQASSTSNDVSGEPDSHSLPNDTQQKKPKRVGPKTIHILTDKLTIVVLAIVIRFLHLFQFTKLFANMIFLPLILLELIVCFISPMREESFGLLGAALLVCGMPPHLTNALFVYVATIRKLILDFSIFVFTFVLTHLALLTVQNYLAGEIK